MMKKPNYLTILSSNFEDNYTLDESSFDAIYGGVAGIPATPLTPKHQTQISNHKSKSENAKADWSPSLQNLLDRPSATFPLKLMLGSIVFCLAFGAWTWLGQIEEVGHARGQLVPLGEPYKIHPIVAGKVAAIRVTEGQAVKAGQVLIELDSQIAANEIERLQQEQVAYKKQWIQTQALVDKTHLEGQTHDAIADAKIKGQTAAIEQSLFKARAQEVTIAQASEKVTTARALLVQLHQKAEAYKLRQEKLKSLVVTAKERQQQLQVDVEAQKARLERIKPLVEEGAIAKERLFEVEQALRDRQSAITQSELQENTNIKERLFEAEQAWLDATRTITQTQGELQQALAEVTRLQAELKQVLAENNRLEAEQNQHQAQARTTQIEARLKIQQLEVQKTQLQQKIDETEKRLNQARSELKQLVFTAPVDGIVLSLNIHNQGEVLQTGQTIAEIAPQNAPLVLIAKLPDKEAGFVKTGMSVKVKLDAYPYQDYGLVTGKVRSISADTKPDDRLGAVYRVEVALERNSVTANEQTIFFKAGQTATADIIIRHRRIADVLLEPFRQLQKGGINL